MSDLIKLRAEHASLAAIAQQLSAMTARNVPPPSHKLYQLRMKLTSKLIHHLKSEDWILYPALLASSHKSVALTARGLSASMGGLASEFKDYSDRWGADAIQSDWKGYQRDTDEILRALALRMTREERDLYPLFEPVEQAAA